MFHRDLLVVFASSGEGCRRASGAGPIESADKPQAPSGLLPMPALLSPHRLPRTSKGGPAMPDHQRHVVIAGGGVAALEAALALRALAQDRVAIELLAPESEFTYRPLAVAEPFRAGEATRFPLKTLVEAAGATLRGGTLESVDAEHREVTTGDG